MAKRSYGDFFIISEKWLGVFFGNISITRGLLRIFMDCSLVTKKPRGLFANFLG
jgi:hypothetical protein